MRGFLGLKTLVDGTGSGLALDLVGRLGSSGSAAVLVEGWLLVLVTGSGELTGLLAVLVAG